MRRTISLLSLVMLASAAGCDSLTSESEGPLTGTWRYTATDVEYRFGDQVALCDLEGTYIVTQLGEDIEGVTYDAAIACTREDGTVYHPTGAAPNGWVVRGDVEDGRVYIANANGWASFGELAPDRVEGYLELYEGPSHDNLTPRRTGTFVMERISHEGYEGPRA
jgi:hypothetical protein